MKPGVFLILVGLIYIAPHVPERIANICGVLLLVLGVLLNEEVLK